MGVIKFANQKIMDNQKGKNEKIDLSRFLDLSQLPIREKTPVFQQKGFNFESFKKSWQRMGKENQIFTIIIVIASILIIVLLVSLFGRGGKGIRPTPTVPPAEYTPPAEYQLPPGEKYTPPFP